MMRFYLCFQQHLQQRFQRRSLKGCYGNHDESCDESHGGGGLCGDKGLITLDFLFAFILVMGFAGLLFALTITLTMVEITQYITYASARNYMTSHEDEGRQREMAVEKFNQLASHHVIAPMFSNDWFELDTPLVGLDNSWQQDVPIEQYLFRGTSVNFIAHMLDFNIPFFGSTASDSTQGGGFRTTIGSYLGIEVPVENCVEFARHRWDWIKTLSPDYVQVDNAASAGVGYRLITDNGC